MIHSVSPDVFSTTPASFIRGASSHKRKPSQQFPRISKPVELLRPSYDVVVIGSGYGGAVAACRMARGGLSVCVLEPGREKWPGEYPNDLEVHRTLRLGSKYIQEGGFSLGEGLGGTGLANANIFMHADKKTLKSSEWPTEIRECPEVLDPYYKLAESVLEPEPYPTSYPKPTILNVPKKQADSTGIIMQASTANGSDDTGVKDGSKTTPITYLSDAWNWGAEIFCKCEVKYVKKAPESAGYIVYFSWHANDRSKFSDIFGNDLMWVHAKRFVFFGAGALGTTEILLRSKQLGLKMPNTVGTRMNDNGDIFAFGHTTDFEVNALERERSHTLRSVGSSVAGIANLLPPFQPIPGISTTDSSIQRRQSYLVKSHNSNQANMVLDEEGRSIVKWLGIGKNKHVEYLSRFVRETIGGTFSNNLLFSVLERDALIYPVGGAAFSSDGTPEEGVTTSYGELLTGTGKEIHEGVVCVDGSVVPTALGVNPFATITALAERSVDHAATRANVEIDYNTKIGTPNLFGSPARSLILTPELLQATNVIEGSLKSNAIGVAFTEVMEGYIYAGGDIEDFNVAEDAARGVSSSARIFLSVHTWDTMQLVTRHDHPAMISGTFTCGALSRDPFLVLRGKFQLFNDDPGMPDSRDMLYDFNMISTNGEVFRFTGRRIGDPSDALSLGQMWKAGSTLLVSIYRSKDDELVGRGILRLRPEDYLKGLQTFAFNTPDLVGTLKGLTEYVAYFTGEKTKSFFGPLSATVWPESGFPTSALRDKPSPTESIVIKAYDGVESNLLMWTPPVRGDYFLDTKTPVLFIPGVSVDHRIFAMPTLRLNAIEYFTAQGATCFCVTHRVGRTDVAEEGWSIYDARLDISAALNYILKQYPFGTKIYVVAHCVGSIALSIGLLDGTIPPRYIKGITCSQVFINPRFSKVFMKNLPILFDPVFGRFGGRWYSFISDKYDTFSQKILNRVLRYYPVLSGKEVCDSNVCHRSLLVFGGLWVHHNVNAETHNKLKEFIGGASKHNIKHLEYMGTQGFVTTWPSQSAAEDETSATVLVTPASLQRLRNIPIYLFSGSENDVFSPESTDMSYTTLKSGWDGGPYERDVFDGFGHLDCWMGEKAASAIWPRIREHMKRVSKFNYRHSANSSLSGYSSYSA